MDLDEAMQKARQTTEQMDRLLREFGEQRDRLARLLDDEAVSAALIAAWEGGDEDFREACERELAALCDTLGLSATRY
ncbi:hypothetical protein [Bradyrhizobium sp. CB3481]|uniref:hypothetical protein n=1 Tax=Bradyrhizobium sp. CB3481 TaxID=3039158 RepID=UPI0024B281F3|nr:hypothetical protein [Bradyrhizobium sp. CB3481]WFU14901.1 hypothetical protein QA643_28350 [Bradyrhizobium sp. CB3481]